MWRFSFNSGRRGSVAAYQFALYNCFGLMESLELKSLFIQASRESEQGQVLYWRNSRLEISDIMLVNLRTLLYKPAAENGGGF